ncbi:MAG: hypothetical protein K8S98_01965 [Planctomycetes bacterium]|nr:hypothetical protein [Planctomycetota bacterium]
MTYSDVYTPNPIANGFEGVITRTWTATDYCGHVTTGVQLISLFSPAQSGGTNFDFKISSCPNVLDRGALGTANLNLLSTSTFNAAKVDSSTLTLQRRFPTTGTTMSLAGKKYTTADYGKVTATDANLCNSSVKDKKIDFRITLPESEIVSGLGLANEAPGTVVEIAIVGRLTTGQYFFRRDFLTVQ